MDYKNEVDLFNEKLNDDKSQLMPYNDDVVFICNDLNRMRIPKYLGQKIDEVEIKNLFLGSISCLGDKISHFYENVVPNILIIRDKKLKNSEAVIAGNSFSQDIYLTKKPLRITDYVSFSHELGHIPSIIKPHNKEYFELTESFPIFLEYIACREIDPNKAYETFLRIRLEIAKEMAKSCLDYNKKIKGKKEYKDRYFEIQKRDSYKYIKSMDLAMQLIDRFLTDPSIVLDELGKYVYSEKSMRNIAKTLDIDTKNCKRLLKTVKSDCNNYNF